MNKRTIGLEVTDMKIAEIYVNGVTAVASRVKKIPKGIIGATVKVTFANEWADLAKTAVFQGVVTKDVLVDGNSITIPAECVDKSGYRLRVGFYGVADETLAIPTIWTELGTIRDATDPSGDTSTDPTLPVWAQLQDQVDNMTAHTDEQIQEAIDKYLEENPGGNVDLTGYATEQWVKDYAQPKGEYLKSSELSNAVNTALAEAKASGEFNGKDGIDGADGKDGQDGSPGKDGAAGYTPVKGKDYFDGKSAYQYAKDGGYTGTEEEFSEKLAKEYPTKVSELANDAGYLTGYTETDPTVPSWAKAATKPSYSKSEVGLGNVDNVKQYSSNNPPPYPVTKVNGKAGDVELDAEDVGARASTWMPTHSDVGADKSGTAASAVSTHNTNTDAHNDIRLELKAINDRLNAFFDSDNQTLDELSEIVAYITNNNALIDSITTSKISVADIINNLTTNVANKPLSSAQGVVLKGLIDTVSNSLSGYQPKGDYALKSELPTKVSQLTNDKNYLTAVPSEYVTEAELTAKGYITGYTETDPTVPSWAKATSKPSYTASEVGAVPTGRKVNNKALSSDITLSASDVSAVPTTRKVNGKALSSNITLSASDVGALPSTTQVPSKTETWTFTLADGSTVTKAVYVG